jgi:drug/metabolite transporter (DMT)-like permease
VASGGARTSTAASAATSGAVLAAAAARRTAYIGVVCTIIGALAFSAKPVIIKLAYQHDVDVMTLLALRMLFALPFFAAMAWWAGSIPATLTRNDWLAILGLGFIGYYLGSFLDLAGLQYISASLGRLILYLYPTLVLLLSAVFLKQRILPRHLLSLALSYGGIVLVFRSEIALEGPLDTVLIGAALVFGSAITYALYLIAGAHMIQKMGAMRFTAYASISATMFVLATFAGTHGLTDLIVPREVYVLTTILAIASTVLPLWLMAEGLKRIGANQVSLLACIGPIATIGIASYMLGEPVTAVQLAGAGLVLAGVVIITIKPQAAPRTAQTRA